MKITLNWVVKPLAMTAATAATIALVGCSAPAEQATTVGRTGHRGSHR